MRWLPQRKAKCELVQGTTGPPCVKCRRELRECIFTAERAWAKRQKGNTPTEDSGSSAPPVNQDHASGGNGSSRAVQEPLHWPSGQESFPEIVGMQLGGMEMGPPPPTPPRVCYLLLLHLSFTLRQTMITPYARLVLLCVASSCFSLCSCAIDPIIHPYSLMGQFTPGYHDWDEGVSVIPDAMTNSVCV